MKGFQGEERQEKEGQRRLMCSHGDWSGGWRVGGGCSVSENRDCTGGSHVPVTFSPAQNDLFTFSDITLS